MKLESVNLLEFLCLCVAWLRRFLRLKRWVFYCDFSQTINRNFHLFFSLSVFMAIILLYLLLALHIMSRSCCFLLEKRDKKSSRCNLFKKILIIAITISSHFIFGDLTLRSIQSLRIYFLSNLFRAFIIVSGSLGNPY